MFVATVYMSKFVIDWHKKGQCKVHRPVGCYLDFLCLKDEIILLKRRWIKTATMMASTNPASTSVGKCTKWYKRDNPIRTARITAGMPIFLLFRQIAMAAERLFKECPDGKEKLAGL